MTSSSDTKQRQYEYGDFSVISRMLFLILMVMEVSDRGLLVLFSFALECLSEME